MKLFFLAFLSVFVSGALAEGTAYDALNSVGKVKGQSFLDHLVSLEGSDGNSRPQSWRMTFEDATSRGGYREIEVRGGEVVGQKAPLRGPNNATSPVNLDRLQLDSDGALTVAEREAARRRVTFSSANYLLNAEGDSGRAVWRVQLLNRSGEIVETLRISADNGALISGGDVVADRGDYVEDTTVTDRREEPESESDSTELKVHRTMIHTKRDIKNGFKRIGGSIQEVFTGRRTIDSDLSGE